LPTVTKLETLKSKSPPKATTAKVPVTATVTSIAQTYTRKENK